MEEYKKLSELPQAVNPQRCEAYGVENGKSVRVPLTFATKNDFNTIVSALKEFVQLTEEIHNYLGERIAEVRGAVYNEVSWSESFNMNDYKTQGIYYITGERLQSESDNLPIMNASSGHTISGQLTVLDASLSDAEQCITQYLKLTNRLGSEGKEYIRTYNKYSNGSEGWSAWRELKQTTNLNQISDADLRNCTENGMYEGAIFNGSYDIENVVQTMTSFFSNIQANGAAEIPSGCLFTMDVLNNYAVVKAASGMGLTLQQIIVQKAKVVMPVGQYVEVQRTKANDTWSGWKLICNIV